MSHSTYKIAETQFGSNTVQSIVATTPAGKLLYIPIDNENCDYIRFLREVKKNGIGIVTGPDIVEKSYLQLRKEEYPPLPEQLDMQFWDRENGTSFWYDAIQTIKNKYPKSITGSVRNGPVPDWVLTEANNVSDQIPTLSS